MDGKGKGLEDKLKEQARRAREAVEKEAKKAGEQAKKVAGKLQEEVRTLLMRYPTTACDREWP